MPKKSFDDTVTYLLSGTKNLSFPVKIFLRRIGEGKTGLYASSKGNLFIKKVDGFFEII